MATKGSAKAVGVNHYANEVPLVPARGQAIVATGLYPSDIPTRPMDQLHHKGVYQSGTTITNAGLINAEFPGAVNLFMANRGDKP